MGGSLWVDIDWTLQVGKRTINKKKKMLGQGIKMKITGTRVP